MTDDAEIEGARLAPSLAAIDALARAALAAMPAPIRAACPDLVIRVVEIAPDEMLDDLGIEDPFELTGLYDGVDIGSKSADDPPGPPDTVWLFRRAILDEWADRGNVTLGELVAHVLVHEVAHHIGYTDEGIAAIDDWTA